MLHSNIRLEKKYKRNGEGKPNSNRTGKYLHCCHRRYHRRRRRCLSYKNVKVLNQLGHADIE